MVQQKTTRELKERITHRSQKEYTVCLQGPHKEVKGGCRQREWQDLGHMPLLWSMGRVFWGSWAKTGLVNSKPKEWGLGKLSAQHKGKTLGGRETVYHQGFWRSNARNIHLLVTLQALFRAYGCARSSC